VAGKYIDKFGLEVEGAWTGTPSLPLFRYVSDGSLRSSEGIKKEYVSEPICYDSNHQYELWNQLEVLYRHKAEINKSMGLHIHVSTVKDGYYPFLTNRKFADYFREYVVDNLYKFKGENKARLKRRLRTDRPRGSSDPHYYCREYQNSTDLTKNLWGNNRYRKVNFTNVGRSKNTIEFRVFPAMTDVSGIKKAYRVATGAINSFLQYERPPVEIANTTAKEKNTVDNIQLEPELVY